MVKHMNSPKLEIIIKKICILNSRKMMLMLVRINPQKKKKMNHAVLAYPCTINLKNTI